MHELSIAVSLIDAAVEKAQESGAERVTRFFVKIGPLSGVVPEALHSAFDLASESTPAEGAELQIEHVPVVVHCAVCNQDCELEQPFSFCCTICGLPTGDIRTGHELELTAVEIL